MKREAKAEPKRDCLGWLIMKEVEQYRELARIEHDLADQQEILSRLSELLDRLCSGPAPEHYVIIPELLNKIDRERIEELVAAKKVLESGLVETRAELIRNGISIRAR